jgi:hypothetical protein
VALEPRTTAASGRTITFADRRTLDVDAVIWATGFGLDHSWIDLPLADPEGRICQRRGVTDTEGLYFLGLPWQHTRGSALLGWVSEDAAYLASGSLRMRRTRTRCRRLLLPPSVRRDALTLARAGRSLVNFPDRWCGSRALRRDSGQRGDRCPFSRLRSGLSSASPPAVGVRLLQT